MENIRFKWRMSKWLQVALLATIISSLTTPAVAQERIYFSSHENAEAQIVARINAETVRLDIGSWLLNDGAITNGNYQSLSMPGCRFVSLATGRYLESDPNTRASFEKLANAGVPIRLATIRGFPEIMHWKCGIFVGQGKASLGSGNWTSFELNPVSTTNFKDETVMITDDASIVQALIRSSISSGPIRRISWTGPTHISAKPG